MHNAGRSYRTTSHARESERVAESLANSFAADVSTG